MAIARFSREGLKAGVLDGKVEVVQNAETFYASEPDPDWRFVDQAGHEHRWRRGRVTRSREVEVDPGTEPAWCPCCGEEHDGDPPEYRLVCSECGEQITPGRRYRESTVGGLTKGSADVLLRGRADDIEIGQAVRLERFFEYAQGGGVVTEIIRKAGGDTTEIRIELTEAPTLTP